MQRGVGHRDATHKHRRQLGYGRELAGSPHLHVDGLHGGQFFLCGVFVGHSPARLARYKTQSGLQGEVIDFVDHAVDVVGQGVAFGRNALVKRYKPGSPLHTRRLFGHREAPGLQLLEHVKVI